MALFGKRRHDGPEFGKDGIPDPPNWADRWAATVNPSLDGALDFSMDSLRPLDTMMANLIPRRAELPPGFDLGPACYLGETLRRNHGGEYQLGPDRASDPLVLVYAGDGFTVSAHFYHRIAQRIEEGDAADIPFYAAGYPEHIAGRQDTVLV